MEKFSGKELEKELKRQLDLLSFATLEITPYEDFKKMLENSLSKGTPLRIKLGIDPTAPDIHLGHLVPFRKMRQFQDLGHQAVIIVGDYTASIGDPSGKDQTRPPLTQEEIKINCESYFEQLSFVVDMKKVEFRFQTEWFKNVGLKDVILWAKETTVAKLLSHETFAQRLEAHQSLCLHELFYPVLQGIDSVYVKSDVELGGSDQKFNVMMGRDYQRNRGMRPQVAILNPILTGLCGTQKMSKSLGNYIGVKDLPFDKFGKVMSIPDTLILDYYKYLTPISSENLTKIKRGLEDGSLHPNEMKKRLATEIVSIFHGDEIAKEMRIQFENVFAKGKVPDDVLEYKIEAKKELLDVLLETKIISTKSEGKRLFAQGAVSIIDGEKLNDFQYIVNEDLKEKVVKIGKRKFLKFI